MGISICTTCFALELADLVGTYQTPGQQKQIQYEDSKLQVKWWGTKRTPGLGYIEEEIVLKFIQHEEKHDRRESKERKWILDKEKSTTGCLQWKDESGKELPPWKRIVWTPEDLKGLYRSSEGNQIEVSDEWGRVIATEMVRFDKSNKRWIQQHESGVIYLVTRNWKKWKLLPGNSFEKLVWKLPDGTFRTWEFVEEDKRVPTIENVHGVSSSSHGIGMTFEMPRLNTGDEYIPTHFNEQEETNDHNLMTPFIIRTAMEMQDDSPKRMPFEIRTPNPLDDSPRLRDQHYLNPEAPAFYPAEEL